MLQGPNEAFAPSFGARGSGKTPYHGNGFLERATGQHFTFGFEVVALVADVCSACLRHILIFKTAPPR